MSLVPTTTPEFGPLTTTPQPDSSAGNPAGLTPETGSITASLPTRLQATTNASPSLSPGEALGVASASNNPVDASIHSYFVGALQNAAHIADEIKQFQPKNQERLWRAASDSTKSLLLATGYMPPTAQELAPAQGGIWHDILSVGDVAKHAVYKAADAALQDNPLTQAWNVGAGAVNHWFRATLDENRQWALNNMEQGGSGQGAGGWLNFLDPHSFIDAWNATGNGPMSYDPLAVRYVRQELGLNGQEIAVAKMAASGMGLQQILASFKKDVNTQAAVYQLIEMNPKFQEAAKILSDSHLTWGQAAFGGLSPQQIHGMFPKYNTDLGMVAQGIIGAGGTAAMAVAAPENVGGDVTAAEGLKSLTEATPTLARVGATSMKALKNWNLVGAGGEIAGSAYGAAKGEAPDQALTVSPFGLQVHPLSGFADGILSWYLNPVQMGFAARGAMRAGRADAFVRAMGNPDEVQALFTNDSNSRRWAVRAAQAMTKPWSEGAIGAAPDVTESGLATKPNYGQLNAMGLPYQDMKSLIDKHYGDIRTAVESQDPKQMGAAVGRMLGEGQAMLNIAAGRMSYFYKDATHFPQVTLGDAAMARLRGSGRAAWGGERFNMAKMSPVDALAQIAGPKTAEAISKEMSADNVQNQGRLARFMRRSVNLTTIGPIDAMDPHSATQLERGMAAALPPDRIADIISFYENTHPALVGKRMAIIQAAALETARAAIDHNDPLSVEWLTGLENRMHFGSGPGALYENPLDPTGPKLHLAILDNQLSTKIAFPPFAELYRHSKKSWLMNTLGMALQADMVDKFMSHFWKPAMLLRPAFGLRVAGEELALFLLRSSPSAYVRSRAAASLTDAAGMVKLEKAAKADLMARAEQGDERAQQTLDAQRVFKSTTSHIPAGVLAAIKTPKELISAVYGWHAVQWLQGVVSRAAANGAEAARAVAQGVAGQDLLDSAAFYNEHSTGLESAYAKQISAVTGHRDPFLGESRNFHEGSMWTTEAGLPLELVRDGTYKMRTPDDPVFMERYHLALSELSDSRWARVAAMSSREGYNAQIQAVEDELRARKLWNDLAIATEDGNAAAAEQARKAIERHEKLLQWFPVNFQTEAGHLSLGTGPTADQAFRDWAHAIVEHVNAHTTTTAIQDAQPATLALGEAGSGAAAEHLNPRPIRLPETQAPVEPYKVASRARGGAEYDLVRTQPNSAYSRIPDQHMRLFTSINTTDTAGYNDVKEPARFWTPSFQRASDLTPETGHIYQIDVPMKALSKDFAFEGADAEDFTNRAYNGQHPKPGEAYRPPTDGHFTSGRIVFGRQTHNAQETLADVIGRGEVPDVSTLKKLPPEVLPQEIYTPDMMVKATNPSMWDKVLSKGFYNMVGRPLDWMIRQPGYLWDYHLALRDVRKVIEASNIPDETGQLAHDLAEERAVREMGRYIHDPRARSQFATVARNVAPFWFATEQFYKRWAHLFGNYPEAWYKLMMTLHMLRSVGFVYTDQNGKAAFTYPFSAQINEVLMHLPFFKDLPIGVGMQSEVQQLSPALSSGVVPMPASSPLINVPADIAAWTYPKYFGGLAQFLQGPNSSPINITDGRAMKVVDQFLPTILARLGEWGVTDATASTSSNAGSALFLTSQIDAARALVVGGHGLSKADQQDPYKQQVWKTRVMHWTENMMLLRALFGFVSPGTPSLAFNPAPNSPGAQLTALMATMPYDQAVNAFAKVNPDATAYDVFGTSTSNADQSGAYVPATVEAGKWLNDNKAFVEGYSQLAPWAMPQTAAAGVFDAPTYQAELNLGLRQRRSLDSWVNDYYYMKGANTYYGLEQWFNAAGASPSQSDTQLAQQALGVTQQEALQHLGIPSASTAQTKQIWDQWKTHFLENNPIFKQQFLQHSSDSQSRRAGVVDELTNAIATGNMPKSEWSTHVEELMSAFTEVQQLYKQTQGDSGASAIRKQYKDALIIVGTQMAKMHPDIAPIWNSVISKQIGVLN